MDACPAKRVDLRVTAHMCHTTYVVLWKHCKFGPWKHVLLDKAIDQI